MTAQGRLRKFGGCDPGAIQCCILRDEPLVLVYSTAQRSTEQGSHESRTAEPASTTLSMTLKALRSRGFVLPASSRRMMRQVSTTDEERRTEAIAVQRQRMTKNPSGSSSARLWP
jgi:hypothetical protein